MPRVKTTEEQDAEVMGGFPQDGDELSTEDNELEPVDPPEPDPPDPLADVNRRLDALTRENEQLKRQIPPATPKPITPDEEPVIDWDKELFADPKGTLKKFGDHIEKKVEKKLRAEYQQDRGTTQFWDSFYAENPEIKRQHDHDLVELTLNSNLSTLANMPVDQARAKLAELTRERILRYAGGAARTRNKRPQTESGAGQPSARKPAKEPQEANVTSIGGIIRARSERRRSKLGAA